MQPQGHVQFLANVLDFGMNVQEAADAPRIRHGEGLEVYVEEGIHDETVSALAAKGHSIRPVGTPINEVGGAQAIFLDHAEKVLLGASDRRKDGCAIGY